MNITFTGENDISLDKAYPMNEEQLESFLTSATPYHFTIHNECDDLASASINLESLTVSGKVLEDEYIDAILYEDNYNTNLNRNKKLTSDILNDENKVITDSKHAYSLYNFDLKPNETRDFNLLLYLDPETPMEEANMNASWKGKITLSTGYKEDSKMLRIINGPGDRTGMWEYKDKLTKIIIEDTKSIKEALDGGKVYGPFDESINGTRAVESYVVCEADDTNCVGYLQSNGKVIANLNSGFLFKDFSNVTNIEGLNNLDTSNVVQMHYMFSNCSAINELDLSSWDTSNVTTIAYMFENMSNLLSIDMSNWKFNDNMNSFFNINGLNTISLRELKLNHIDLSNISNSKFTFGKINNLEKISLENVNMSNSQFIKDIFNDTIQEINLENSTLPINCSNLFYNLSNLIILNLNNVYTGNVTNMNYMFSGLNLTELNLSSFDTSNLSSVSNMFSNCVNLKKLDLSNWKFNDSITTEFAYRSKISDLPIDGELILKNIDTSEVTNMTYMFAHIKLSSLDLSYFDTTNVTNMSSMFYDTSNLEKITFGSKFIHKQDAIINSMFTLCSSSDRPTGDSWSGVSFD